MDKRDTSAPMDYTYENGGPAMDVDSPFVQFSQQREPPRKRTHFDASIQDPNPQQNVIRFHDYQQNQFHNHSISTPTPTPSFGDNKPFTFSPPVTQPPNVNFGGEFDIEQKNLNRRKSRRRRRGSISRSPDDSEDEENAEILSECDSDNIRSSKFQRQQWNFNPDLPDILSRYLQLFCLFFLFCFMMYYVRIGIRMVKLDIDQKSDEYSLEFINEMANCRREYEANRCSKDTRVPAMGVVCDAWESCMNKDPSVVGRARVSAETFAEILNAFIEPIAWKTMAFLLAVVFGTVFLINFAFGHYRAQRHNLMTHSQAYHQSSWPATQLNHHQQPYIMLKSSRKSRSRSRQRYVQ